MKYIQFRIRNSCPAIPSKIFGRLALPMTIVLWLISVFTSRILVNSTLSLVASADCNEDTCVAETDFWEMVLKPYNFSVLDSEHSAKWGSLQSGLVNMAQDMIAKHVSSSGKDFHSTVWLVLSDLNEQLCLHGSSPDVVENPVVALFEGSCKRSCRSCKTPRLEQMTSCLNRSNSVWCNDIVSRQLSNSNSNEGFATPEFYKVRDKSPGDVLVEECPDLFYRRSLGEGRPRPLWTVLRLPVGGYMGSLILHLDAVLLERKTSSFTYDGAKILLRLLSQSIESPEEVNYRYNPIAYESVVVNEEPNLVEDSEDVCKRWITVVDTIEEKSNDYELLDDLLLAIKVHNPRSTPVSVSPWIRHVISDLDFKWRSGAKGLGEWVSNAVQGLKLSFPTIEASYRGISS